jgi:hypothetical protein
MLKKTLIAAAALTVMVLGATSPAAAHYKGHYNFSWYVGSPSYAYRQDCSYEPRLITIRVWNGYGGYYFKKVWRDVRVCY